MSTIPANGLLADAGGTLTTANAKTALEQLRDCLNEIPGGAATSELTISGGAITPVGFLHSVDTESDAPSDNLDNIVTTNHPETRLLLIYPENGARTVVVRHEQGGAGQIHLADDLSFTMDETDKLLMLYRSGADWYEWNRSYGASLDDFRTYLGLGDAATKTVGVADGNVIAADATGLPVIDGSQLTGLDRGQTRGDYLLVQDQKAATTEGGTFTSGAWRTRTLQTEVVDEGSVCTLASNQMTLIAGTYRFRVSAPAFAVEYHQARLAETTGTVTINGQYGTKEYTGDSTASVETTTRSLISGTFTVTAGNVAAGQNIFEVQHYCSLTQNNNGFGVTSGVSFGVVEVYTVVEMWRVD